MNQIYRLVWSPVLSAYVPVAETSRGRGKGAGCKLIAAALLLHAALAQAAPNGAIVIGGTGSITHSGATTTINQATQKLSLTWKSFNIAPTETVNFVQPSATAIAVNRIFDTNGTKILGQLNANGQVYLINPNGILFGQGAQVNVGALVASTLDLNDAGLNNSSRTFSGSGSGSIVNQGTIQATGTGGAGGYVALLGRSVSNQGAINAPLGTVTLGAGNAVTLNFNGSSLVNMLIDQGVFNTLVENGGLIKADGGKVFMSAGAKDSLLASVVNNTGVIEARTVGVHEGSIILLGGMTAGTVNVGGTLDASAPNGGNGGFIETSAATVKIEGSTRVTTSAPAGTNGTWLIDPTNFTIAAGSGASTTSGIGATTLATNLGSGNVSIATSATGSEAGDILVNSAVSWSANKLTLSAHRNININANLNASSAASLALNYGQSAVAAGNTSQITTTNAAVNLPAGTSNFTTRQGSDGAVKAFTVLTSLGAAGSLTATDLQGMNGAIATNYALGSNIDAAPTSTSSFGTTGFAPIMGFTGTFDGLGHTVSGLFISAGATGSVGLFGSTGAGAGNVIRNVGLLGASVSAGAATGALLGSNSDSIIHNSYATGTVSGAAGTGGLVGSNTGGTISNSYANVNVSNGAAAGGGGLVGTNTSGSITNSYATGSVTGAAGAGGLLGSNTTGAISNSYATGNVTGAAGTGGLVGSNTSGNITNSYATGAVNNGIAASIGGLLGSGTGGNITNSYAAGSVTGGAGAGGLVGDITTGSISNSYAFGAVIGGAGAGGLVGTITTGNITNSYATGSVKGDAGTGGLVGVGTSGVITNSYATGLITGAGAGRGGLIGATAGVHVGSFWDKEATGMTTSVGAGAIGMTTAQMKDPLNFTTATAANGNISPAWVTPTIWTLNSVNYPLLTSLFNNVATVTANNRTATYQGAAYTSGYTANTVMAAGFTGPLTGTLSYYGTSQAGVNVGSYVVTPGGQSYGGNPQNVVSYVSGALSISAKALSQSGITVAPSKVYDATTAASLSGTAVLLATEAPGAGTTSDGKAYTGDTVSLTGTAGGTYNSKDVATATTVTLSGTSLTGAQAGNYTLTAAPSAAATISAKALSQSGITVAPSKVYDATTAASLSGTAVLLATEAPGAGTTSDGKAYTGDTVSLTGTAGGTYNSKDVATATTVTLSGTSLTGAQAGNYTLTAAPSAAATISAKALTASGISASNKVYDASAVAALDTSLAAINSGASASGDGKFYASDAITLNTTSATGAFTAGKDVGMGKTVSISGLALGNNAAGNYILSAASGTSADISAKALTATITAPNKIYDGSITTTPTFIITGGLLTGETVTASGTATFDTMDAGTGKTVTATSNTLANGTDGLASNYSLANGQTTTANVSGVPVKKVPSALNVAGFRADFYQMSKKNLTSFSPTLTIIKSGIRLEPTTFIFSAE